MATNFSPCKGSYVLNQFPSNVMFGMNGFHVSASGAIQGHHGPLVYGKEMVPFDVLENILRIGKKSWVIFFCHVYFNPFPHSNTF